MPLYEYECDECGHRTEELRKPDERGFIKACYQPCPYCPDEDGGPCCEGICGGRMVPLMSPTGYRRDHTIHPPMKRIDH